MIYTALCIMLLMHAAPLRGQVGGDWALEIESFWALGNVIESIDECPLGLKKFEISRAQPTPTCLSNGCCTHQKHCEFFWAL
jgi:hypothetical protein